MAEESGPALQSPCPSPTPELVHPACGNKVRLEFPRNLRQVEHMANISHDVTLAASEAQYCVDRRDSLLNRHLRALKHGSPYRPPPGLPTIPKLQNAQREANRVLAFRHIQRGQQVCDLASLNYDARGVA